jgi:hypothetical protein
VTKARFSKASEKRSKSTKKKKAALVSNNGRKESPVKLS